MEQNKIKTKKKVNALNQRSKQKTTLYLLLQTHKEHAELSWLNTAFEKKQETGVLQLQCLGWIRMCQKKLLPHIASFPVGSVPICTTNFEPFGEFRPKINWFTTWNTGSPGGRAH